jgi:exonuclease III
MLSIISDVPNSGKGLVRLKYRAEKWDRDFTEYLKKLDTKKPVIMCGDLNVSHTPVGTYINLNKLVIMCPMPLQVHVKVVASFMRWRRQF